MAEMTQAQFEVVAELLRSREPVRTAARLVLVEGVTTKDAAGAAGMQPNAVIGSAVDQLMRDLRALGLNADTCDRAFELEAAIYAYAKQSNPDATVFPVSEGFGSSMDGPARERVLAQAAANRDFLRRAGVTPN